MRFASSPTQVDVIVASFAVVQEVGTGHRAALRDHAAVPSVIPSLAMIRSRSPMVFKHFIKCFKTEVALQGGDSLLPSLQLFSVAQRSVDPARRVGGCPS